MSFIAIGLGAVMRSAVREWWAAYKARHENGAVTMKLSNGVWRPSRLIPRVERVIDWASYVGMVIVALSAAVAVYWQFR